MKIAILTANFGNFDTPVNPVSQALSQEIDIEFHRFTDEDFPPITGLTSRLQYRIPKLFGWEMFPGADIYLWHDSSMSLQHEDSVKWFLEQLGDKDMAVFKHPWRKTAKEETDHIEEYLNKGNAYISSRYKNGLHKEQYREISKDISYVDDKLYTSTAFIYRNTRKVQDAMKLWWYYQSRYFTCDQIVLPYVIHKAGLDINVIQENQFKSPYISLVSHHK